MAWRAGLVYLRANRHARRPRVLALVRHARDDGRRAAEVGLRGGSGGRRGDRWVCEGAWVEGRGAGVEAGIGEEGAAGVAGGEVGRCKGGGRSHGGERFGGDVVAVGGMRVL